MPKHHDDLKAHPMDRASEKGRIEFNRAARPEWPPDRPGGPVSRQELREFEQPRKDLQHPKTPTLTHPRPAWARSDIGTRPKSEYERTKRQEYVREGLRRVEGIPKTHFRTAAKDPSKDRGR